MSLRLLIVICAGLLVCIKAASATAHERPNIVFILADDLGSGDLGCYNAKSQIETPNIDRLAAAGVRMTDAHSPSAVCTPTRYGVLTGRYAWRTRLKKGVLHGYSRSLIRPERMTVASLLKAQGYATACIGKWHLGFQSPVLDDPQQPQPDRSLRKDHPHAVDYSKPLTPGPSTLGFDFTFGIPASLDMEPYVFVKNDTVLEAATEIIGRSEHRRKGGEGFWRGGPIAPSFRHVDVLPRITGEAVNWIGRQAADRPFFLYFPLNAPHTPWLPTDTFRGQSEAGYYGDFVAQVDAVVGRVMSALDKRGVSQNTLIIVTSDNGSHWPTDDIRRWQHEANLHNRGQKADIWEGGHRVPLVARWPGHIPPGAVSDQTVCLTDLLATAAALVDAELPAEAGEDSVNILPALLGEPLEKPIRPSIIHHSYDGTFAIRAGDWKLIVDNLGSGGFSEPRQMRPGNSGPQGQLYNLAADPSEENNVWEEHSDVVARLTAELERAKTSGRTR